MLRSAEVREIEMLEEIVQMDIGIFPAPLDMEDYAIRELRRPFFTCRAEYRLSLSCGRLRDNYLKTEWTGMLVKLGPMKVGNLNG